MNCKNPQDKLAMLCRRMYITTQIVLFSMLALNVAAWIFPPLRENGIAFSLTDHMLENFGAIAFVLPWWQKAGAILVSSIPLMVLAYGLYQLGMLFRTYARRAYFSAEAAGYMGKTAKMVILWVIVRYLSEPLLSLWITMNEPVGKRSIMLTFSPGDVMVLFLGACIWLISYILYKANRLQAENEMFI